jgi:hypothetical protein
MLYGSTVWDPVQIVTQIAAIQGLCYISGALLMALFVGKNKQQPQLLINKNVDPSKNVNVLLSLI